MSTDIRTFVRASLHCPSKIGAGRAHCLFGPSLFGVEANELLQFDYVGLGLSSDGTEYVIKLRDDHSEYNY